MSAERFQIDMDELGCWARQSNETWACVMHFTKDSDILQVRIAEKVIRQQARDIAELEIDVAGLRSSEAAFKNDCDQLRADLAAAVAERDRLLAELPLSTGRDVNETRERLGPITRIADDRSTTSLDAGRVTGTAHDYSCPDNFKRDGMWPKEGL